MVAETIRVADASTLHRDLFALLYLFLTTPGGDGVQGCREVVHFIYTPSVREAQRRRLHIGILDGVFHLFPEQELTRQCSDLRTQNRHHIIHLKIASLIDHITHRAEHIFEVDFALIHDIVAML